MIVEAKAKVSAAQDALKQAQDALTAAQKLQMDTNKAVLDAEKVLQDKQSTVDQKADALAIAQNAVDQAQANYDNNLIETPIENAEPTIPGLQADIYTFNPDNLYPERNASLHTFCKTITVSNIDTDWGGGNIEGCGEDFVIIHYTGFLTVPTSDNYEFHALVDDGWHMTIGNTIVNDNWVLKGCGGWWSQPVALEANKSYAIDAWMYEYGGGACNQLLYMNSQTWNTVPADWFSQNEKPQVVKTKDPALLIILQNMQAILLDATLSYQSAQSDLSIATTNLAVLQGEQSKNVVTIDVAQQSVTTKQEELSVAKQELAAIPPFKDPTPTPTQTQEPTKEPEKPITPEIPEPVTPTPTEPNKPELPVNIETVNPQELTASQVTELISVANEILNNSEQGSPEYEQALEALFVAAEANDITVSEDLAAIPLLGNAAVALTDAINFIGNVGADMSPKVREESEKIVVTAVVAVGAAVNAATGAALGAAAPSAGGSSAGGSASNNTNTRRNKSGRNF
jgi:hypothetical protein